MPHRHRWGVASLVAVALLAVWPAAPAGAATMRTSFYGAESGRYNADGSRFAPMGFTAAHRTLPFGTRLEACYRACAIVTVRDRGPAAWTGRSLDLARGAARAIGLESVGVAAVAVTILGPRAARHSSRRNHRR